MKVCEKCSCLINGKFGSGRFCSRVCANSRPQTEETKRKLRLSNKTFWGSMTPEDRKTRYSRGFGIQNESPETRTKRMQNHAEHYANRTWDEIGWDSKRKRVIEAQSGTCSKCGISEWREQQITLEVDHKDGDRTNNERENLEGLCPNCHSLTPSWRGKNRIQHGTKITDSQLRTALNAFKNIRQALVAVGLSPKGNNYNRAKRLMEV